MSEVAMNVIDGKSCQSVSGRRYEVMNPANPTEVVGTAPLSNREDVDLAIEAAHVAFPSWSDRSLGERAQFLMDAANALRVGGATLKARVRLFTRENGKVLEESGMEFARFGDRFSWCASQAERLSSEAQLPGPPHDTIVTHQPRGVASLIVPWNWPMSILGAKLPQALLAGNTVVINLAHNCPLAPLESLRALANVLPPGVINAVATPPSEIGDAMIVDPRVRTVDFTGSIETGKAIMKAAATSVKSVTLELGGNDPALVLDDADLTREMVERMVAATFMTSGQVCTAVKRILVASSRYEEFVAKYSGAVDALVVGNGLSSNVTMGPLISKQRLQTVRDLMEDARNGGATVAELGVVNDEREYSHGFFQRPTVIIDCDPHARVVEEEQFGPIVPILPVSGDEEAIRIANNTEYGLGSSVWSESRERAVAVARRLEAGYTFLNGHGPRAQDHRAPHGGAKQSGIGRNLGFEGLIGFMEAHSISAPHGWLF